MTMKTEDEIILFLVKNSKPDKFLPIELTKESSSAEAPLYYLLLRLCGATRYTVPLEDFEAFLGEKYDFEKHLRTIHDSHILRFRVAPIGDFYDSQQYRTAFACANGLVRDYEQNASFVAFHIRNDGEAKIMFDEVLRNVRELGLDIEQESW